MYVVIIIATRLAVFCAAAEPIHDIIFSPQRHHRHSHLFFLHDRGRNHHHRHHHRDHLASKHKINIIFLNTVFIIIVMIAVDIIISIIHIIILVIFIVFSKGVLLVAMYNPGSYGAKGRELPEVKLCERIQLLVTSRCS